MLSRQSVTDSSQNEKAASRIVPTTGTAMRRQVVRPDDTDTTAPTVSNTATEDAITRKVPISSSILGRSTMIEAPNIAPVRVFRPPMMMASRNRIVSSKL